ncbi:MAG: methyltransferase [Gemmatales bacterium]|nr:MAG: methyltransferase [Gemmatales bacterium]
MHLMSSLKYRDRQPEWMDDPFLDESMHRSALAGLRRLNRVSRSASIVWRPIRQLARDHPGERLTVLDMACGGGDVALTIVGRARCESVQLQIDGCDISPVAIEVAREAATRAHLADTVRFFQHDVLNDVLPQTYDVVMCTLFLHHLSESDSRRLLLRMQQTARRLVLINDLRRTRLGFVLAWLGCRLLTRSPVVHLDGPLSVRAAYRTDEVLRLAESCGMRGATISTHWPQRFLLQWRRSA